MSQRRSFRTLDNFEENYFRNHPEEIDSYITEIFENFAYDKDLSSLLASLRIIARVKNISSIAEDTGLTRQGVQKALSPEGNPKLSNINSIMHSLGYYLTPKKIDTISRKQDTQ